MARRLTGGIGDAHRREEPLRNGRRLQTEVGEHPHGTGRRVGDEPGEHVLGADHRTAPAVPGEVRGRDHVPRVLRERQLAQVVRIDRRQRETKHDEVDLQVAKRPCRDTVLLSDDAEQEVLGADRVVSRLCELLPQRERRPAVRAA
jgi:hypothetical protein